MLQTDLARHQCESDASCRWILGLLNHSPIDSARWCGMGSQSIASILGDGSEDSAKGILDLGCYLGGGDVGLGRSGRFRVGRHRYTTNVSSENYSTQEHCSLWQPPRRTGLKHSKGWPWQLIKTRLLTRGVIGNV